MKKILLFLVFVILCVSFSYAQASSVKTRSPKNGYLRIVEVTYGEESITINVEREVYTYYAKDLKFPVTSYQSAMYDTDTKTWVPARVEAGDYWIYRSDNGSLTAYPWAYRRYTYSVGDWKVD